MGLFGNLFGKKSETPAESAPKPALPQAQPQQQPAKPSEEPIRVFDAFGRETLIPRKDWRAKVLPANLNKVWDKPAELYGMIASALTDGFHADVVEATQHLYQIDGDTAPSVALWAIVLREEAKLDESETVLRAYTEKHGDNAFILLNLAKVAGKRNDAATRDKLLWRSLRLDPNSDNAVQWYAGMEREKSGELGGQNALLKITGLEGSWRAQLWLARAALAAKQPELAIKYYRDALTRRPKPAPGQLLMQMSGDLGNAGLLAEMIELAGPLFDIQQHGLMVGNNLIKANLDLGNRAEARRLVDALYACNRADWRQTLGFWENEIAKACVAAAPPVAAGEMKSMVVQIAGPVWLTEPSPAWELFPAKLNDGPKICFLGSSATASSSPQGIQLQLANASGQLSRALPLFLAEQVHFATNSQTQSLIPLMIGATAGFVLCAAPWGDESALKYARESDPPADFVAVIHVSAQAEPWNASLRLLRVADGQTVATLSETVQPATPGEPVRRLGAAMIELLADKAGVQRTEIPAMYSPPDGPNFAYYLRRLEQLLAVRCAAMENVGFVLNGARDIIDGDIQTCLASPESLAARLVLAQTLRSLKKTQPRVAHEFGEKLALLEKQKPAPEAAKGVMERMINE